jgi:hypothetical protein
MRSFHVRRHHPLATANAALEHLVLRHFGLQLSRTAAAESPPRRPERAGGPGAP